MMMKVKTKKRCQVKGCAKYKYKGDEKCIFHIQQKYYSYFTRSFGSISGLSSGSAFDNDDDGQV